VRSCNIAAGARAPRHHLWTRRVWFGSLALPLTQVARLDAVIGDASLGSERKRRKSTKAHFSTLVGRDESGGQVCASGVLLHPRILRVQNHTSLSTVT
jgi:hypothetical protein